MKKGIDVNRDFAEFFMSTLNLLFLLTPLKIILGYPAVGVYRDKFRIYITHLEHKGVKEHRTSRISCAVREDGWKRRRQN